MCQAWFKAIICGNSLHLHYSHEMMHGKSHAWQLLSARNEVVTAPMFLVLPPMSCLETDLGLVTWILVRSLTLVLGDFEHVTQLVSSFICKNRSLD